MASQHLFSTTYDALCFSVGPLFNHKRARTNMNLFTVRTELNPVNSTMIAWNDNHFTDAPKTPSELFAFAASLAWIYASVNQNDLSSIVRLCPIFRLIGKSSRFAICHYFHSYAVLLKSNFSTGSLLS